MPAPPLDFAGPFPNTSPDSLSGPHNVDTSFSLINSPDDYVMMSVADSSGLDLNHDVTIQPRSSIISLLVINNAAGTNLLTLSNTGNLTVSGTISGSGGSTALSGSSLTERKHSGIRVNLLRSF